MRIGAVERQRGEARSAMKLAKTATKSRTEETATA
jgi:hypothetical protein